MADDKTQQPMSPEQVQYNPQGWANPPTLETLKQNLTDAKSSHDAQVTQIQTWLDAYHVRGASKPKLPEGNSQVTPQLIRKQAEWRYPALSEPFLTTDDMFTVEPRTWEDSEGAQQQSILLNYQFNTQINKTRFIDEYVRTCVDSGTVLCRVGWEYADEEITVEKDVFDYEIQPDATPMHEELHMMMQEDPTRFQHEVPEELQEAHRLTMESGQPHMPVPTGETEEVIEVKVHKNAPTVEVCDYRNVIIDPSCQGKAEDARFIIYSFETSLSELEKSGRYDNLDKIVYENSSPLAEPDHASEDSSAFNFSDKPRKRIVAYEYWGYYDFDDSGVVRPFVSTWVGQTIIRMEKNPFPDGKHPFIVVPLLPIQHSCYGQPDGALLEDNQKVVGAVTRGMIDILAKSANGQRGFQRGMLDATNKRKFLSGADYEFNAGSDPQSSIHTHKFEEIPMSAQFLLQQQTMDAESLTGVKAFNNGVNSGSLGEVAAGIRGALDAASKRETSILRRLASGIEQIGRKFVAMNQEFLEDEEVVRVTNGDFVPVRRDDMQGNFDLRLSVSSAEEDNVKAQELAFMLQTMGNNMDPAMTQLILRDITRLRKMPELAKQIEDYEPQPDPLDQQLKELEIQKLQAEIADLQARAAESNSDAQLNQAKIGTEQAKARQLGASADITDLDFVEQESGVKQEREKELHGEQARANVNLEREKARIASDSDRQSAVTEYLRKKSSEK